MPCPPCSTTRGHRLPRAAPWGVLESGAQVVYTSAPARRARPSAAWERGRLARISDNQVRGSRSPKRRLGARTSRPHKYARLALAPWQTTRMVNEYWWNVQCVLPDLILHSPVRFLRRLTRVAVFQQSQAVVRLQVMDDQAQPARRRPQHFVKDGDRFASESAFAL